MYGAFDPGSPLRLVPFQPEYLRSGEALPFGLRDATGRLLLAAGQRVEKPERLAEMRGQSLFAEEGESATWYRRLAAAMDQRLREGAQLREVAAARPAQGQPRDVPAAQPLTLPEEWAEIVNHVDGALRDLRPGGDWRTRLLAVHGRARALAQRRTDNSLYLLVYEASHSTLKYSSHHAVLTMLICEQAASLLGWPTPWIDSLGRAALVMNVAMLRLQDQLAVDDRPLTAEVRAEIEAHPARGAQMLADGGWLDTLCLETVRLHHDGSEATAALASLPPARQLARLLGRVDNFAAQISLRASRPPISPVQAAREACLSAAGVPDEVGGAMLRAVGLYPPGSFVELACGEVGIVVARGRRANMPYVASLLSASGSVIAEPALRDTIDRRFNVKSAVPCAKVKVRPPHERLLAMR